MSLAAAARAYRMLLRLLAPRPLRTRHGVEMEALFLDLLVLARTRGRLAAARAWSAAAADLVLARGRTLFRPGDRPTTAPTERPPVMLGSDLRGALRSLWRQKVSSALAIVMLALGLAANVAVFTLVKALFLRPFPFPDGERVAYINEQAPRWNLEYVGINYPDFAQWQSSQQTFTHLAAYDGASYNLSDDRGTERITGAVVTRDFAEVLGVRPLVGRMFTADEDRPDGPPVVVLSEGLWRERFGADRGVLGRTLRLNSQPYTIVGVLPSAATFPERTRLWTPLAGDPNQAYQSYSGNAIGRLKPGVTVEEAESDLRRAHAPVWEKRDRERNVSPFVRDLRAELSRNFVTAARTLVGAVALLLLVACANVASVMLARALARRREMAIRLAIGAGRLRLLRQLFIENVLLAAAGGALGLLAGQGAVSALIASMPPDTVPEWAHFGLDARVIAFAAGVTCVSVLLFGWAPALHALRGNLRAAVHDTSTGTTMSPRGRRTLGALVAAECALAAMLLVCGGLLVRAYDRVAGVDPGFRTEGVLSFAVSLPEAPYPDAAARLAFWDRLQERLAALPSVRSAGLVTCPPLGCHEGSFFEIPGRVPIRAGDPNPVVLRRFATPGYVEATGVSLVAGRAFRPGDGRGAGPRVALVNETFVRTFWPAGTDPIGRQFRHQGDKEWVTVVGVTRDIKHYGLERPMRPGVYFPVAWQPPSSLSVVLHTAGDPAAVARDATAALRALDPELPAFRMRTMEEALARSLRTRAIYSWMLGIFAAFALVLAVSGIYGVTAYLTSQRRREVAIRMALGASRTEIVRTVVGGGMTRVVVGVGLGLAGAVGAGRLLSSLLFGVPPHDPTVLMSVGAVLVAAAVLATIGPAKRAARVDPMVSLRTD